MMKGLDPVKMVKKMTKEVFAKKMAKKKSTFDEDNFDMPDFKVSNKGKKDMTTSKKMK